jgi:tRNA (cytidine/uridine-2'-O-)-methyltransferase
MGLKGWSDRPKKYGLRDPTAGLRPAYFFTKQPSNQATKQPSTKHLLAIHVVLVHPEIHWNTGNAGRSCLATGAQLHLVAPLGFSLDDREVKRAGLDYWEHVNPRVWPNWDEFERTLPTLGEAWFFSTKATRSFWDAPLSASKDVVLIFGRETGGLAPSIHERYRDRMVAMPMGSEHVRSLNLSTSVGVALYEVLRQRRASETK